MRREVLLALILPLAACHHQGADTARPVSKEIVWVPPPPADPAAPVIDEIRIEKDAVCAGEEDLVTVTAHSPAGDDECLSYVVGGQQGRRTALLVWDRIGGELGPSAAVFDCSGRSTLVTLPDIRAVQCQAPGIQVIQVAPPINTRMVLSFSAAPVHAPGFSPVRWRWDFGDGSTEETTSPAASHDFWRLPQDASFLQLLVTVTAEDAAGAQVTGRLGLQVFAAAWGERRQGRALVFAQPVGSGTSGPGGVTTWDYLLWHHESGPIALDRATATRLHLDGSTDVAQAVDLAGLATIPVLPSGDRVQVTFRHDFAEDPAGVYVINYVLEGEGSGPAPYAGVSLFSPLTP